MKPQNQPKPDTTRVATGADLSAIEGAVVIFANNGQRIVITPSLAVALAKDLPIFAQFARHISEGVDIPLDTLPAGVTMLPSLPKMTAQ